MRHILEVGVYKFCDDMTSALRLTETDGNRL